ncbi:MAG: ankyrin repeat domain-containing protein [Rhodospirillales bacterium]
MHRSIILMCLLAIFAMPVAPKPLRAADLPATTTTFDLVRAAAAGDLVRLAQLLQAGADPNVVGTDWRSPLIHAVGQGRLDMVRALVRAGARVDWQDADKVTPLILAAHGGYPGVAEYLILAGADPMVTDRWGRRALDYALMRGKNDAVARMLRRAEINRPLHKNK